MSSTVHTSAVLQAQKIIVLVSEYVIINKQCEQLWHWWSIPSWLINTSFSLIRDLEAKPPQEKNEALRVAKYVWNECWRRKGWCNCTCDPYRITMKRLSTENGLREYLPQSILVTRSTLSDYHISYCVVAFLTLASFDSLAQHVHRHWTRRRRLVKKQEQKLTLALVLMKSSHPRYSREPWKTY